MKNTIRVILIIMLVAIIAVSFVSCKKDDIPAGGADSDKINLILDTYYFAQGDVDLEKAFPGKNMTVDGTNASVSGKTLTVTAAGEFTLNDGDKSYKGIALDNAANVATFEEYVNAMTSKKHICLQSDITEIDPKFITVAAFEDHGLQSNVYGNGHYVCVNEVAKKWYSILDVRADDILIRDIHVSGYHVEPGADIDLTTFENIAGEKKGAGAILNITGPYSAIVKHCAFENGHKVAFIREGKATIEDCVFRNASDTLISIETSSCKGAEVTLKNNLLANAVVAGVCLWGWNAVSGDESYVTLNVEGFLDIYNWKEGSSAKLMPGTEKLAGTVNPLVAKEFDKEEYQEYFYVEEDGSKYIHCGIVKLCTSKLKSNKANMTGLDGVNFEIREFPLPSLAKIACNECQVIGYGNTDSVVDIRPIERLTHNKNASKIGIEFVLSK